MANLVQSDPAAHVGAPGARRACAAAARVTGVALVALAGCGQWDDSQRAHDTARDLLECFDVAVERTEAHRFHAAGCGRHADIVCSEGSLEPVCIRVRERGDAVPGDDDDIDAPPDDGRAEADETVALSGDASSIEEVLPDPLADDEAPDDDPGAVRTSGGEASAAEAAIRRGLDARAGDVMACVDRDRVAVRVTHHADGTVRVALTGDLAGTPEEGCVRSALGDVRAPAGASGVVLHLVRRSLPPDETAAAEPVLVEPPIATDATAARPPAVGP